MTQNKKEKLLEYINLFNNQLSELNGALEKFIRYDRELREVEMDQQKMDKLLNNLNDV